MAGFLPGMSEKQRLVLSIAAATLSSALLGTLWFLGHRESGRILAETAELEGRLKAAEQELDRLPDLQRQYRERGSQERRLTRMLPDRPELERLYEVLADAERLAGQTEDPKQSRFLILSGKVVEEKKDKGKEKLAYEETRIDLNVQGSWAGLVSFLDSLEHADRLIAVRGYKSEGGKDTSVPTYQIQIAVFHMKEADKPAPRPAAGARS